jgi:sec-independent protein translocase protein TatA
MHFDYAQPVAFFQNMGAPQILLIVFLILLLFGAKRLPELARGMGKALREFKSATKDIEDDIRSAFDDDEQKASKSKSRRFPFRKRLRRLRRPKTPSGLTTFLTRPDSGPYCARLQATSIREVVRPLKGLGRMALL